MLEQMPNVNSWEFVGCLGAEERCTAVPMELVELGKLGLSHFFRIEDNPKSIFKRAVNRELLKLRAVLENQFKILDAKLMSDLPELVPLSDDIESSVSENVILDISCLPKRFFFYLLRRLVASPRVRTLVVTVTIPSKYGNELSKNAARWDYLPSFGREQSGPARPMLIIGAGYQHLNLLEVVDEGDLEAVRLLFPFPSKPPGGIKNWEFVRNIERQKKFKLKPKDVIRVHPQATSLAFDILAGQCESQSGEVWLAPFGPKSMSLAMALFALAREANDLPVSVGYTQPLAYSATYSIGVERDENETPIVHAYCIKLNGRNWYSIPHPDR